jgi:hypothetical protein
MSRKDDDEEARSERKEDTNARPVSDRALVIFFVILATALLLGYLLLSKLADISTEEDCALARRRNCGARLQHPAGAIPPVGTVSRRIALSPASGGLTFRTKHHTGHAKWNMPPLICRPANATRC